MGDIRTIFHRHSDGQFTIQRHDPDVEPTLEWNKALRSQSQTRTDGLKHIASIPAIVIEKWIIDDGVNVLALRGYEQAQYYRRKLDDPQWQHLKTTGRGTKWR
jgi:hypothetical protein